MPAAFPTTHALKALAVAALACSATLAAAATASVTITSVTVSTEPFAGTYAWQPDLPYQNYGLSALQAGGNAGADSASYTADDWMQGDNLIAQTASANATANTDVFTDVMTGLSTAGFNLGAQAQPQGATTAQYSNYANATAIFSGSFKLIDADGNAAVGWLYFNVDYKLNVEGVAGDASTYGQALVSASVSNDGGFGGSFTDGLLSTDLAGGTGSVLDGHFTWALPMAATDTAYFTLGGSAIAAAVPEAPAVAMWAAGLLAGLPLMRRRVAARRA